MTRSTTTPTPLTWCRFLREQAGIKQRDLADTVGISQPMLSRIESGGKSPSLRVARALSQELGVAVAVLFPQHGAPAPADVLNEYLRRNGGKKRKAKR